MSEQAPFNNTFNDPKVQEYYAKYTKQTMDLTHALEQPKDVKTPIPGAALGKSVLNSIIDIVSRGEYATANIANVLAEKEMEHARSLLPGSDIQYEPLKWQEATELAWKGVKGDEKHTYDELIERKFPSWSGPKKFAVSFMAALAFDPTTYIPGAAISKPVKAVAKTEPFQKAAKTLEKTKLGEAFIPYAGTPSEFKEFMGDVRFERQFKIEQVVDDIRELNRGLTKDDREMFSYYRQHPAELDRLPAKFQTRLEDIGNKFDEIIEANYANGMINKTQYKAWKVREGTYLPGVYKGQRRLGSILPPQYATERPSFLKQKRFETLEDAKETAGIFTQMSKATSVDEMRKIAEANGIDFDTAFKASERLPLKAYTSQAAKYAERYTPEEDILKLLATRKFEDIAYTTREQFLNDVTEQFGKKIPWDTKVLPEGYGMYFPKGKLRIYPRQSLDLKAVDVLTEAIDSFRKIVTEETGEITRKTTKTTTPVTELAEGAKTKATAIWESRVRDAMKNRGFSDGEASIAIEKIRESGGNLDATNLGEQIVETTEETFRKTFNIEDLDDFVPADVLESMIQQYPALTKNVPAYMMDSAIAREVNRASKAFINDPTTNYLLYLYDSAMNIWKTEATALRIPFHLRNFYSNLFLAHQAGINNPARFVEALDVQTAIMMKRDKIFEVGNYRYTPDQMKRALNFLGVRGTGWLGTDIEKQALKEIEWVLKGPQKFANPVNQVRAIGRGGRAVGTFIEDNARIAVFLDQLKKGVSPKEAAKQVRKYLFDYNELTETERNLFKRMIPFYTWTRKNFPLQAEMLVRKPKTYALYAKGYRAYGQQESSEEMTNKPAYFDKMMFRKTAMRTDQGKPIYAALDLPPLIFNQIADSRNLLTSLGPYRTIGELIVNKKFFPELSDIEKKPGAFVRAPVWLQTLPDSTLKYLEDKKLVGPIMDMQSGGPVLGIRGKYLHAINGAFPFLSEVGRITADPITLTDERPGMWKRSYLSGITQKAFDEDQQIRTRNFTNGEIIDRIQFYTRQRQTLPTVDEIQTLFPEEELRKVVERDFIELFQPSQ